MALQLRANESIVYPQPYEPSQHNPLVITNERLIQVNDPKNRDRWIREFLGSLGSSLADAVNRGFSDEDEALRAFADEADKLKLGAMATEWRRVLSELKNPENHRDGTKVRELFNECSKVNYDFMVMIIERFKVLLAQEGRM